MVERRALGELEGDAHSVWATFLQLEGKAYAGECHKVMGKPWLPG